MQEESERMTALQELEEFLAEVKLRRAVRRWAKANPKSLDMETHTHANGKRYIIHIRRCDYSQYKESTEEGVMDICGKESS